MKLVLSTNTIQQAKLELFKQEALNIQGLSLYELLNIHSAKYRMQVKKIIYKHIQNDKYKRIPQE